MVGAFAIRFYGPYLSTFRQESAWLILFDDFEEEVWRAWQLEVLCSDLLAGMDIINNYSDSTIYAAP